MWPVVIALIGIVILLICALKLAAGPRAPWTGPRLIWSYWHSTELPQVVQWCRASWVKWNPDYTILLLNKANYAEYVDIPESLAKHPAFNDSETRFADLLRLFALAQHGGVWLDASVLVGAPLDSWLTPAEVNGFTIGKGVNGYPTLENWVFASQADSRFMQQWRDEFVQLANHPTVKDYVSARREMGVNLDAIDSPEYLAMHVAAQKVLQLDKYPLSSFNLTRAEDGPFRYLVKTNWQTDKALELACKSPRLRCPLLKLRGRERDALEKRDDLSLAKCGWV